MKFYDEIQTLISTHQGINLLTYVLVSLNRPFCPFATHRLRSNWWRIRSASFCNYTICGSKLGTGPLYHFKNTNLISIKQTSRPIKYSSSKYRCKYLGVSKITSNLQVLQSRVQVKVPSTTSLTIYVVWTRSQPKCLTTNGDFESKSKSKNMHAFSIQQKSSLGNKWSQVQVTRSQGQVQGLEMQVGLQAHCTSI